MNTPAELSCFWASLFSPCPLSFLWCLLLQNHLFCHHFVQCLCWQVRMSASHCPSKETAESENCSNTESRNGNLHVKKKKKKLKKKRRRSITHYKCTDQTEKHATHTRWMCTTYLCIWVIVEASLRIVIVARRLIILIGGCIRNSCELANTTALTMVVKIFLGKLEKTGIEIKTHSRFNC